MPSIFLSSSSFISATNSQQRVREMGEMNEKTSLMETPIPSKILIPEAWSQAANSIAFSNSVTSPSPVALICGPKNSGKTTFSRILLNTLLQRYKKVAYLDTDVGQPEFTPPGFLSLSIIDKHTSDFTIACLKTPDRCVFYGDTSAKRDPKTYLDNIFSLYDYFYKEYYVSNESEDHMKPQLPLVINTHGWVKGIGYDTLVEMLKYIAPTHVVKLYTSSESRNLPSGAFWLDSNQKALVQLIEIGSALRDVFNRSVLVHKDAPVLRDLRIVAYFRQCFPVDYDITTFKELSHALASHPPYEVPISRIKVKHLHCQVPSSEIFHSLNATIVGLAVSAEKSSDAEPCTPWCVGLGIVRGIDVSKGLLYVLTPVPRSNLEKVDLFLQGLIPIPNRLLQVHGCISPYISTNVLST